MTIGFHVASNNFCKLLSVSWEVSRIRLNPLKSQVFNHDSISMIVSRFTAFTENFVIYCYQITKIFCTRYGCVSAFSARSPCHLGSLANLAIFVLRDVSKNTMFPDPDTTFTRGSGADSREELAGASLCSGTLSSTRFSVNSCKHSDKSSNRFSRTLSLSFFPIFAGSCDGLLHTVVLELSLLVDAECSASCNTDDGDAGVDELQELLDTPRTTIDKKFVVLHLIRVSYLMTCGFWQLVHSKELPWSWQSFPSERTAGVSSRSFTVTKNPILWSVASSFVCTSPLALIMVDGLSKTLTVSNSAEFRSFWLNMCIWGSGIYNKFSFLRFYDGWHSETSFVGRWEESSFVRYFELWYSWPVSTRLREHIRSCLSISSWDLSSNFKAYGLRWWGTLTWNFPSDGSLSSSDLFLHDAA